VDFRSLTAGGRHRADALTTEWLGQLVERHPVKYYWFLQNGYRPHIWQALFHGATNDQTLTRFRHLVAGRRGGKTFSAAWEVLFYALHPEEFHRDAHGEENGRPLWIWALARDNTLGRASLNTFIEVIRKVGLHKDSDYRYNKTEKVFEFYRGEELLSTVEFRSADDPQRLRGAGLDILWIDESAFIPTRDAWDVVRPALSDKLGIVLTTTTPNGKNWFYEQFFVGEVLTDPNQFRVEYTSIDNPYFAHSEWEDALQTYHPIMFRQEYMAAFDALAGIALSGDWLKYYVLGNPDMQADEIGVPKSADDGTGRLRYDLDLFIGVDPAISLREDADDFAMALVGITKDRTQAYVLDYFLGHIAFPDQLDKIREWFLKYRPQLIGIEANAYQRALLQMTARMEGLPNVIAVISKSKKEERILGLGPLFKTGKVRIRRSQREFIDQWVSYDPAMKHQHDDLLDAVEIALGTAGVLLPVRPDASAFGEDRRPKTLDEEAWFAVRRALNKGKDKVFDPELGDQA
jgi:predicted phage terminase large subunit-like protein